MDHLISSLHFEFGDQFFMGILKIPDLGAVMSVIRDAVSPYELPFMRIGSTTGTALIPDIYTRREASR